MNEFGYEKYLGPLIWHLKFEISQPSVAVPVRMNPGVSSRSVPPAKQARPRPKPTVSHERVRAALATAQASMVRPRSMATPSTRDLTRPESPVDNTCNLTLGDEYLEAEFDWEATPSDAPVRCPCPRPPDLLTS